MDEHGGPIDEYGDHDTGADDGYGADHTDAGDGLTGGLDGDGLGDHDGYGDEHLDTDGHELDLDPDAGSHDGDDLGLEYGELSDGDATDGHEADAFSDVDEDDQQAPALDPDPVPGTDPDLDLVGDDPDWAAEDVFPPQLEIGEPPEPVDGFPWSDPAVLGEQHDLSVQGPGEAAAQPSGSPDDLFDYDGQSAPEGVDPWQALAGSDDPATSSLARFWAPGS
ncbi:hypothetical protein [Actinocatenispora sera]|uniref:hypothetical protein n=1 Tax=Actinocatenispora sera TaxID=390989 RepID=UPI0004C38785|nr:hypothetical protein [Actinocatenispora sera]